MTLFLHNIRRPYSTLQFTSYGHDAEKGISTNPQTKKIVLWMRVVFGVIKYFSKGLLIFLRVWHWFFSLWSSLKSGMANVPLKKSFESMMILNAGLSPYVLRNSCCNDACNSTSGKLLTSLSQKHSYNINTNFCICWNLFVGRRIFPTQNYGSNTASKQYLQIPFFSRHSFIQIYREYLESGIS